MKHIRLFATASLLFLFASPLLAADADGLAGTLRQVVEQNLAAYNSENTSRTLASVDTNSPAYATMKDDLPKLFRSVHAHSELAGFTYIGHDDEFAVARVQYRTVGDKGAPFRNNIVDTMTFFHQQNGAWKYWDNYVLGVRLVK
jgi:hypothetical protein